MAVALRFELDHANDVVDRPAAVVERAEQPQRLQNGQLVVELRVLQLDSEALPQHTILLAPTHPEHLDVAGVVGIESFQDFNRRGLPGTVRPEQPEALPRSHVEIETVNGGDVAVALDETGAADGICAVDHGIGPRSYSEPVISSAQRCAARPFDRPFTPAHRRTMIPLARAPVID